MEQSKNDVRLGRFISLVLRHNPEAAGITLDENGWVPVRELLAGMNARNRRIDMKTLERIVRENNKSRYTFNDDHTKIRASQGHSIDVDVEIKQCVPPDVLYHGTGTRSIDGIKKLGITRQQRLHVHLSADRDTAVAVGRRHGKPAVLVVDAGAMAKDGLPFWLSENGVWLCEAVAWKYIIRIEE